MSPLELDAAVLFFVRTRGHSAALERAISTYSRAGEHGACWFALGLAGAVSAGTTHRRRAWLRGMRVVAAAYSLNFVVKLIIRRGRPELPDLPPLTPTVSRLSFPSAHATTSFAAARAYAPVAPAWPLYGAAAGFALSRPYLGVHYPSDVAAGALLGIVIAEAWPR